MPEIAWTEFTLGLAIGACIVWLIYEVRALIWPPMQIYVERTPLGHALDDFSAKPDGL